MHFLQPCSFMLASSSGSLAVPAAGVWRGPVTWHCGATRPSAWPQQNEQQLRKSSTFLPHLHYPTPSSSFTTVALCLVRRSLLLPAAPAAASRLRCLNRAQSTSFSVSSLMLPS